jgi:hypothetical protein
VSSGAAPPERHELQKQYELVLQEYRFQVQLNWDRTKHFLIFNTAIFAAAVALYKGGSTASAKLGIAVLMILATANSFVGRHALSLGHEMYRNIRGTKTKLEKLLGLADHAILSTAGMKRDHDAAPEGTPGSGRSRIGTITFQLQALLVLIGSFSAVGAVYAIYEAAAGQTPATNASESVRP